MYEKSITREHRTAFVVLIDQSGSMSEPIEYEGRELAKAEAVALVTNQIIAELIERARRHDGVRDYYDVAVLGYSGEGVTPMISHNESTPFVSIDELSSRKVPLDSYVVNRTLPSGESAPYTVSTPQWVTPRASGETPMFEGLNYAYDIVKEWSTRPENYDSFPPIVFNITDGESSDCSPVDMINISRKIRSLSTSDGKVFMINIHIASSAIQQSMLFPTAEEVENFPTRKARELSYASSTMPDVFCDVICELKGVKEKSEFIGVSYNTSIAELITILNIGTISVKRG
ncbi:MAG: vWA domain-containing protein [Rikenellaceae bacterium]